MKKLEMIYGDKDVLENGSKLLFTGKLKGVKYFVINKDGQHPCGYVEVTGTKYDECAEFNKLKKQGRSHYWARNRKKRNAAYLELGGAVHGGITYSSGWMLSEYQPDIMEDRTRWFVGWDYAHLDEDDYVWSLVSDVCFGKTMYSTDDVIEDCKRCIERLLEHKTAKKGDK